MNFVSNLLASFLAGSILFAAQNSLASTVSYKRVDSSESSLTLPVAFGTSNRIALENEKISSLIFDEKDLIVKILKETGEIFVVPRHIGKTQAFLATSSGSTIAITFEASESNNAQNIVLARSELAVKEAKGTQDVSPIPFKESDFPALIKKTTKAIFANELNAEIVAVKNNLPISIDGFTLLSTQSYKTSHFWCYLLTVKNSRAKPQSLPRELLATKDLASVSADFTKLPVLATGQILLIFFRN